MELIITLAVVVLGVSIFTMVKKEAERACAHHRRKPVKRLIRTESGFSWIDYSDDYQGYN